MRLRQGGAWRNIRFGFVRQGGAWRPLVGAKIYFGAAWKDVGNFTSGNGAIHITLSTSSISKSGSLATLSTGAVTATPTGGQTPYTYSWFKVDGGDISATSPNAASTQFQATGLSVGETRTAQFRCTAQDVFGSTESQDVSVSITRN